MSSVNLHLTITYPPFLQTSKRSHFHLIPCLLYPSPPTISRQGREMVGPPSCCPPRGPGHIPQTSDHIIRFTVGAKGWEVGTGPGCHSGVRCQQSHPTLLSSFHPHLLLSPKLAASSSLFIHDASLPLCSHCLLSLTLLGHLLSPPWHSYELLYLGCVFSVP